MLQNEQGSGVVKDNKESLNKKLLQELYLVRNIVVISSSCLFLQFLLSPVFSRQLNSTLTGYASATNDKRREALCIPVSVRPSVNIYFACRDISVLSGGISVKLDTNICHVRAWQFLNKFQGHRSKVKAVARWNALSLQRDTYRLTVVRPLSERRRHTFWRCALNTIFSLLLFTFM